MVGAPRSRWIVCSPVRNGGRGRPLNWVVRRQLGTIGLPFTVENARAVIATGASESGAYSHAEIAEWCERFWNRYSDTDAPPEIERIMPVLADVESQWDMHLANELAAHPDTPPNRVRAPREWFKQWSAKIDV